MLTIPNNTLVTPQIAADLIGQNIPLCISGSERLLSKLPPGRWIGGTTCYFTGAEGGIESSDRLFVTVLPNNPGIEFKCYHASTLGLVMADAPDYGFSLAIIPAGCDTLQHFSAEGRFWREIEQKPIVGWIAGVNLARLYEDRPVVFHGPSCCRHEDAMVVAHVPLPPGQVARVETINMFGADPRHLIRFPRTGNVVDRCTVNGKEMDFADFLIEHGDPDGRLPLIGDFDGASFNVSVMGVDPADQKVTLYAPVFADIAYRLAKPVANYKRRFAEVVSGQLNGDPLFSCNCILNYLYGEMQGKALGCPPGPVTFGEIANLLHNQTVALLSIDSV